MLFEFDTAANVIADARGMAWFALFFSLIVACAIAFEASQRRQRPLLRALSAGIITFFLFVLYIWNSCLDVFVAANVTPQEVRLRYPLLGAADTSLQRHDIARLWFGSRGKTGFYCYLRFELRDGTSYYSASIPAETCKDYRSRIIAILKLTS